MNEELTIEQAQAKLDLLKRESLEVSTRIIQARQSLAEMEDRLRRLNGNWRDSGLIGVANGALAMAKRRERDDSLRTVVWENNGYEKADIYVIDKVTAKRIFVRAHGAKSSDQYTHDGKPVGYGSHQIDIAATFGPDGPVPGK